MVAGSSLQIVQHRGGTNVNWPLCHDKALFYLLRPKLRCYPIWTAQTNNVLRSVHQRPFLITASVFRFKRSLVISFSDYLMTLFQQQRLCSVDLRWEYFHRCWKGKDLEGGSCGLLQGTIHVYAFRAWGKSWKSLVMITGSLGEIQTHVFMHQYHLFDLWREKEDEEEQENKKERRRRIERRRKGTRKKK